MKITLRGVGVGVRDDGKWVEKRGGRWEVIPPPPWASNPTVTAEPVTAMLDPYKREPSEVVMVPMRRVVRATVPDYEAEVLLRNGWEYDED